MNVFCAAVRDILVSVGRAFDSKNRRLVSHTILFLELVLRIFCYCIVCNLFYNCLS